MTLNQVRFLDRSTPQILTFLQRFVHVDATFGNSKCYVDAKYAVCSLYVSCALVPRYVPIFALKLLRKILRLLNVSSAFLSSLLCVSSAFAVR